MSTQITIPGRTVVSSGTLTLGQTDSDNNIEVTVNKHKRKVHTNNSGPHMWDLQLNLGITVKVSCPLILTDPTNIGVIAGEGAGEGVVGTLGASVPPVNIVLTPQNGSKLTFTNCWILDSYQFNKFGYEPLVTILTFEGEPPPGFLTSSSSQAYTYG